MLHRTNTLYKEFWIFALLSISVTLSCKDEGSSHSEEEEAYMADYESPDHHWGFINLEGKLVIEADFDDVGPFSEGIAAVNKNGKWGYINTTGEMIIEPVYKSAWAFHEGFARVMPFDGPDQFINRTGKVMKADNWSAADDFSDGRARVKVGNSFGFVDTSGQLIIQPIYTRGWNFNNGLCVIEYQEKLGVINQKGDNLIPTEYDQIKKVSNGKILLCTKINNAIAYDQAGKEIIKLPGSKMVDSNGDLISVREGSNMYLLKLSDPEKKGTNYTNIIFLEENLWAGKLDSGYVLLDRDGNQMTTNYYKQINKFYEGIAAYSKADYWGYLDTTGQELTEGVFGLAWDYKEGLARAAFQDGIAFIDKNQKLAFYPPRGALDMRDFSEGFASVQMQ
ncbi:MAG TPA: WG repeat-containing protein [Saprospiraceae bacterium]|nr:WG repeat-containing protein [Saprospiraceae bacterium]